MLREVLRKHERSLALLVGNGINRYVSPRSVIVSSLSGEQKRESVVAWDALVLELWRRLNVSKVLPAIPEGISLTELYDMMALEYESRLERTVLIPTALLSLVIPASAT